MKHNYITFNVGTKKNTKMSSQCDVLFTKNTYDNKKYNSIRTFKN